MLSLVASLLQLDAMAAKQLSEDSLELRAAEIFDMADKDSDGRLDKTELYFFLNDNMVRLSLHA